VETEITYPEDDDTTNDNTFTWVSKEKAPKTKCKSNCGTTINFNGNTKNRSVEEKIEQPISSDDLAITVDSESEMDWNKWW